MDAISLSQHYMQMAHALQPFMPSTCRFLNPGDVKLVGTHPMAAGGFADIWEATYEGRRVAFKSYRCYTSSDVAPVAEVHYNRSICRVVHRADTLQRFYNEVHICSLLHHKDVNVVPFVGVFSAETHPFTLIYEHMDGLDLKQYLRNEPNARRLKLVHVPLHASTH